MGKKVGLYSIGSTGLSRY